MNKIYGIEPSFSFKYDGVDFKDLPKKVVETENSIKYTLEDGLEIETIITKFPKEKLIWWKNVFTYNGKVDSKQITELYDCDLTVPFEPDPVPCRKNKQQTWNPKTFQVIETRGANVQDDDYFQNSKRLWENSDTYMANCILGRSGMGTSPFFDINRMDYGILLGIGWTGQWKLTVKRNHDNARITAGIEDADFRMHPGESFRTASIAALMYDDGSVNAHNRWRSYMRAISPLANKGRGKDVPFSAIFWGGIPSSKLIERWQHILDEKLPFDTCWVDAGWYEPLHTTTCATQSEEWSDVGTWEVSTLYHPKKYVDVTDFLHKNNIKFMLWFEPERVAKTVPNHKFKCLCADEDQAYYTIALNEEETFNNVCQTIGDRIEQIGVDVYRQDYNIAPIESWRKTDEPNRKGTTEIHYINNMYRYWDYLLNRFPNLLIDNCCGGGHRNDIEMLSRAVPMWRSDYQCTWDCIPEGNQVEAQGAAAWIPYSGIGYGPTLGDLYSWRSAYTNGITVRTWEHVDPEWEFGATNEPLDWARKYFDEYLSVRHYFAMDFYPLVINNMSTATWACSQYHDSETDTGIILGFRRELCPSKTITVELGGLSDDKVYIFENVDTGEKFEILGKDAKTGLDLTIEEKKSSHLWKYCPKK